MNFSNGYTNLSITGVLKSWPDLNKQSICTQMRTGREI